MTTYEKSSVKLPHRARPMGVESVRFRDGMLVSADDLEAASAYAASLLRVALRAHLGCGVVCGLGVRARQAPKGTPVWTVCVERGTAVDCRGFPVELLAPVELDLSPDPCASEPPPSTVLIALRRLTSQEAPRDACLCADREPDHGCSRVREQALVRAFTEAELGDLPGGVCRRDPAGTTDGQEGDAHADHAEPSGWCAAMTECDGCGCDADWVLLGSVRLDADTGIVGAPDTSGRRWVKPVEALCQATALLGRVADLEGEVADLTRRLRDLDTKGQRRVDPASTSPTPATPAP